MKQKLYATAEDLAAANVGSMLCQFLLDKMIANKLTTSKELSELLDHIARFHMAPGDPRRQNVRQAAAALCRQIQKKYDEPTATAH